MKGLFTRHGGTDPVWLAEEIPEPGTPLSFADRACCCPARPAVTVVMPPGPGRPLPVDLLLCGHHYRASRARLHELGASVYDEDGSPIRGEDATPGDGCDTRIPRRPSVVLDIEV